MPGKALLLVPSDSPEKGMGKKSMDGGKDMGDAGEGDGEGGDDYSAAARQEAVSMLVDALGVQGADKSKVHEALTQFYENC